MRNASMLGEKSARLGADPLVEKARALVDRAGVSEDDSDWVPGRLPRDMCNRDTKPPRAWPNDAQVLENFGREIVGALQLLTVATEELQARLRTLRVEIKQLRYGRLEMLARLEATDNFLGVSTYKLTRDFEHVEARISARLRIAATEFSRNGSSADWNMKPAELAGR